MIGLVGTLAVAAAIIEEDSRSEPCHAGSTAGSTGTTQTERRTAITLLIR